MFRVHDAISHRHTYVRGYFGREDAAVAILLAAADFERTIRRAILALGSSPTAELKARLFQDRFNGLDAFKEGWRREVKPNYESDLAVVVKGWDAFRKAYGHRHRLIHGATGKFTPEFAGEIAGRILRASLDVHEFAGSCGHDLDKVIRRTKARSR